MTVILLENHREKRVAVESLFRAGFIHEPEGKAHLSHVVEHMVVQSATESYKAYESFKLLQERGMANAETLAHFVHYDSIVDSGSLELVLKVVSERLTKIQFSEDVLKEEIPKCLQEIEAVQRTPQGGVFKFALMALNQVLRYGAKSVPLCRGTLAFTPGDVQRFYQDCYRPDDALLILAGDFDPGRAKGFVEKYFAGITGAVKGKAFEGEAGEKGAKPEGNIQVQWDVETDAVFLVFPRTNSLNEDLVLTLFGNLLNGFFYSDQEVKKVSKISFASNQLYPVGELPFFIYGEAREGGRIEEVRQCLKKALQNALKAWNPLAFVHAKMGIVSFIKRDYLESGSSPSLGPYEALLGQQALEMGIKELLKGGVEDGEFLRKLEVLEFKAADKIIQDVLARGNEREIILISIQEKR